jgi:hypothetical protein
MPDIKFFAVLMQLNLHYDVCGERGTVSPLPPLRLHGRIDISQLHKCYEITGDRDPVRHTGQGWRAFTNKDRQIVYIENVFAYTGP